MSCIEKMTIQGIRSFGPDTRDVQCIQFFTPLTLILGPNGTGKTTIIECLKYMTTGDLPPGGKQNGAFIHDPKIAGETVVNAQIQLLFRDLQSQRCCAKRSLTATQKHKKVEMKTVDNIITRTDKTGNRHTINSKCAEIDREMVQLLGVAKPILDSVIFCHQEEANWPLSEPTALKKKFDDIFASTRYVKALEVIRKFRTEQKGEIDVFKGEIKYLKQNKDKAADLQDQLQEQEDRYVASKEAVNKIKEKIQPIREKLNRLKTESDEIYHLQTRIEKKKTEQAQIRKNQQELRKNIRKEFPGSTPELRKKLQDFGQQRQQHERQLRTSEGKHDTLAERLADISDEKSALLVEQGVLQQEAQTQEQRIKSREKIVNKLAQKYGSTGFDAPLSDRKAAQFIQVLQDQEQELEDEIKAKRAAREEKEQAIQQEIDELKSTKTRLETELAMKLDTLNNNRRQIREIKQELSRVDASAEKLTDVQRDLKRIEKQLDEVQKSVDLDDLKAEVTNLQQQKSKLDVDLKQLDTELNRLSIDSTARTQLDMYKKEKTAKLDNVRKSKSRIEDSMTHILGYMPTEYFRRELDKSMSKISRSLRQKNDQLQRSRHEKTTVEAQCKMRREQLASKEDELRGYESKLNNVSGSQNFDEGLEKLQKDLRKAQEEKGHLKGIDYLYRKYEDSLKKNDPPCPLCRRPFDQQTEVDELVDEIKKKTERGPRQVRSGREKNHIQQQ